VIHIFRLPKKYTIFGIFLGGYWILMQIPSDELKNPKKQRKHKQHVFFHYFSKRWKEIHWGRQNPQWRWNEVICLVYPSTTKMNEDVQKVLIAMRVKVIYHNHCSHEEHVTCIALCSVVDLTKKIKRKWGEMLMRRQSLYL